MENMTLSQLRQQYPQYNDIPDEKLAQMFHAKYGNGRGFMDFMSSFWDKVPSFVGTAEAADVADYRRGGTSARLNALQDAARMPQATPVAQRVSTAPTTTMRPRMTIDQASAAADRMIAQQRANEAARQNALQQIAPEQIEQGQDYRPGWKYVNGVGWIQLSQ